MTLLAITLSAVFARAETVLRYGMSMADIPLTTGEPPPRRRAVKWRVDDKNKAQHRFQDLTTIGLD